MDDLLFKVGDVIQFTKTGSHRKVLYIDEECMLLKSSQAITPFNRKELIPKEYSYLYKKIPTKITKYINVYEDTSGYQSGTAMWDTVEEAERFRDLKRKHVDVVEVSWEE